MSLWTIGTPRPGVRGTARLFPQAGWLAREETARWHVGQQHCGVGLDARLVGAMPFRPGRTTNGFLQISADAGWGMRAGGKSLGRACAHATRRATTTARLTAAPLEQAGRRWSPGANALAVRYECTACRPVTRATRSPR